MGWPARFRQARHATKGVAVRQAGWQARFCQEQHATYWTYELYCTVVCTLACRRGTRPRRDESNIIPDKCCCELVEAVWYLKDERIGDHPVAASAGSILPHQPPTTEQRL